MDIKEYQNYKENADHLLAEFAYNTYLCSIPLDFPEVPGHWHEDTEIIYIKKGSGLISVEFEERMINAGDFVLVLPGQLHSIKQNTPDSMEYENILFDHTILLGKTNDIILSDFIEPLLSGQLIVPTFFTPIHPSYNELVQCLDACDKASEYRPKAYQLFIKSQLLLFFYTLCGKCTTESAKRHGPSLDKLKLVTKYVELHYAKKITIEEIASVAGFSESHFMKYFKNACGVSFIEYLNDYRLTMAARMLLAGDEAILIVAEESGYDNLSYFNRCFKKKYGKTPREYRK